MQQAARRSRSKQDKDEIILCPAGLADIDELNEEELPETFELLPMTVKCHYCGALGFESEVKITTDGLYNYGDMCCRIGEVKIKKLPPYSTTPTRAV